MNVETREGIVIKLNKTKELQTGHQFNEAMVESTLQLLEQVVSTLDLEEVLKRIVEAAVFFSEADEGSLLLLDEETGELYMRAAKGFGDYYVSTYRQPIDDDSIAAQVMKTGRPVLNPLDEKRSGRTQEETDQFPRSVLNLPIKRGDVTKGILAVYSRDKGRAFTHRHLLLLSPLAQYAAVAIENARRYQEARQLLSEAYSLTDLAALFTETRDLIELLYLIASQALGRLEQADRVIIHLLDSTTGRLERKVRVPAKEDNPRPGRGFAVGQGIAGQVILEGGLVNIRDINSLVSFEKRDLSSGSLLVAPISKRILHLGTISVASPVEAAFKNQEERFLMSLANLAAMAIENARIFGEERARAAQLKGVAQLAEKLISILDLDELLDQTVSLIHERFGFEDVAIKLFDPQVDGLVFKVAAGLHADNFEQQSVQKSGEGMIGWAAQTGKTFLSNDVSQEPRYRSLGLEETKSELDVPLKYRDKLIGVLDVQSESLNAFSRHDVLAMEALAAQVAVAIENARLYKRQVRLIEESQARLEAVERRNRELNSLRGVLGALQSTLSLPEVLARITKGVVEGLSYRVVMLSTIDEAKRWLTVEEFAVESGLTTLKLIEQAQQLTGQKLVGNKASLQEHTENLGIQVCLDGQIRVTHSIYEVFRPIVGQKMCGLLQKMFQVQTIAVLPIRAEDRLFGVLYAATEREQISQDGLESLEAFANQAAVAIKNARQFEDVHERLRRRVREMQGLQDIERLLSTTPNLETMLKNILSNGLKLVGAECGNIVLYDNETGKLTPKVSYPEESISVERYESGLTAWFARKKKTAPVPNFEAAKGTFGYRNLNVQSELAAPIFIRDELVGAINIGDTRPDAFTHEDESLLDILATQTAAAIQVTNYYQELEETRLRSFEAERIAAMSDMATNMVHNINNSTGAIRVLVQQIRRRMNQGTLTDDYLLEKLAGIETSADKTLNMARNIRNPFQHQPTESIDINISLKNSLQEFLAEMTNVELLLNLDESQPFVMVTRQLEEVFRNLIRNALEAMAGTGVLHISSRQVEQMVQVTVTDSGGGIPGHLSESAIFNLGVSSKRDGLGYGLWWCKIYLNRVGGNIRLDTSFRLGARFIVDLPVNPVASAPESGWLTNLPTNGEKQ